MNKINFFTVFHVDIAVNDDLKNVLTILDDRKVLIYFLIQREPH